MSDDTRIAFDNLSRVRVFVWYAGWIAWLAKPLPRGHYRFYQFRWEWMGTKAWLAIGRLAIRIPGYVRANGRLRSPEQIADALRWACSEYEKIEAALPKTDAQSQPNAQ